MKIYSAPRTRAIRPVWLCEELEVPYELVPVEFKPTVDRFFIQDTPTGKIPTLEDGDVVVSESGAILEYILETHAERSAGNATSLPLGPRPGAAERATYLQWMHFAESTAWAPISAVVWLGIYREGKDGEELLADARSRAVRTLSHVDEQLGDQAYLLRSGFSAADIMMGFTLAAAQGLGLVTADHGRIAPYLERLLARPAFTRAAQRVGGFTS